MTDQHQNVDLPAGLYLVATPIGNLKDITLRALETLHNVDVIYCEDTRQSAKLLSAHNIKTQTATYHDHSKENVREKVLHEIRDHGKSIALISDAGMPLISDPGFKLVQSLQNENIMITSLPGANAPLTALQLSGMPCDQFTFLGFLPNKSAARKSELSKWSQHTATLIFYEAKQRVQKTLKDIEEIFGGRAICVARELTKKFEEVLTGSAAQILEETKNRPELKGEFVILIAPYEQVEMDEITLQKQIIALLKQGQSVKGLSEKLAQISGWQKKEIYNLALTLKDA